jgi:hypothetical protein
MGPCCSSALGTYHGNWDPEYTEPGSNCSPDMHGYESVVCLALALLALYLRGLACICEGDL